ncbi:putative transcriptional regulator, TetR family protein [Mycobacterium saskatchewanense]|uniref:TetR family transcriptional regulator n=1 Tax=Mycobacterium saskatchewanense TaxID=220927 RepID=A0AAJ3TVN9_9MYCO|nr:TetR/AcrR family transcriptional regulator [Mycobacterium saskatchewanense]ORW69075.1 TetR family transcriptional regulator [Mycobacterium saskatchewanense]BBX61732.1 putative transcriptional regulator, TetR family protein [Mycobacterium saskatchewanense]
MVFDRTVAGTQPHRGNRHGRSEAAREAILRAADDLLVEKGFAGVTVEGIARAAGVAKQTVYRWWNSKTDVLMDAFLEDAAADLEPPDTGSLESDLRTHVRDTIRFLTTDDAGAVYRALVGQAQHDEELARTFRARYLHDQQVRDQKPFVRAVARGELSPETDVASLAEWLMGPVHYRVLVTGEPVDDAFADRIVDSALLVCTRWPTPQHSRRAKPSPA